jgi:hypothetical protein
MGKESEPQISRRRFLHLAALSAAGVALTEAEISPIGKIYQSLEIKPLRPVEIKLTLIDQLNQTLAEPNLTTKYQREKSLFKDHKDNPIALEKILPAVMHREVREEIIRRRWAFRTNPPHRLPQTEAVKKYRAAHPPISRQEIEFCNSQNIYPELYASLKDNWEKITDRLDRLGFEPPLNLGALAKLIQTETGYRYKDPARKNQRPIGGGYIGDGPAHLQWNPRRRQVGKFDSELKSVFTKIESRTGLRYDIGSVFGSTWPDRARRKDEGSGGALGIQFMPHNVRKGWPKGVEGLNPFDIYGHDGWADAPFMSLYFLSRRIGDKPLDEKSLRHWNGDPIQIKSILDASTSYVRTILHK